MNNLPSPSKVQYTSIYMYVCRSFIFIKKFWISKIVALASYIFLRIYYIFPVIGLINVGNRKFQFKMFIVNTYYLLLVKVNVIWSRESRMQKVISLFRLISFVRLHFWKLIKVFNNIISAYNIVFIMLYSKIGWDKGCIFCIYPSSDF